MSNKVLVTVFVASFLAVSGFIINSGSGVKNIVVEDAYTQQPDTETIDVVLSGSVKNPGKHTVYSGLRLYELLALCGGVADDADLEAVNTDSIITSSRDIFIPKAEKNSVLAEKEYITGRKCNINTAGEKELSELNGIGSAIAKRIVQYRNSNGLFKTEEEIMNVKGIGEATYTKIKEYITVEGE